ncbi:MAG: isoprenylcysteine carboxylmethyltransferase family protein [Deltaproteobacteria bacterium]|nr:isoprenylcysteine carboxylmethyltransferase family protein [Deltaproteobacteria bacterium]
MGLIFETVLVAGLFAGYAALWAIKRRQLIETTGLDPEVLAKVTSPVQAYFARLVRVFTVLVSGLVVLHGFIRIPMGLTARLALIDNPAFDIAVGVLGVLGLSVCWLAQRTMRDSWRLGIDKENKTPLVTNGIFRLIRNPTYLGLHVVNLGVWFIWPTAAVGFYAVLFFVVMEIQVRAEEEQFGQASR